MLIRGGIIGRSSTAKKAASAISIAVGRWFTVGPLGGEAEHERVGEGPRLAGDVGRRVNVDADFFEDLAVDGVLERFARARRTPPAC